ncbi:uncharacterized protein GBIM_16708, partial [Gryllus bimaculatus]
TDNVQLSLRFGIVSPRVRAHALVLCVPTENKVRWYLVWKLFLSRFRFVRELLGAMSESASVNDLKNGRSRMKKTRRD